MAADVRATSHKERIPPKVVSHIEIHPNMEGGHNVEVHHTHSYDHPPIVKKFEGPHEAVCRKTNEYFDIGRGGGKRRSCWGGKGMKYVANPVEVEAHKIIGVGNLFAEGLHLALENGQGVVASPEMTSRMTPKPGDYWVIQSDGYTYLNPKDVFEKKYHPVE
jgi:hypothetical protein